MSSDAPGMRVTFEEGTRARKEKLSGDSRLLGSMLLAFRDAPFDQGRTLHELTFDV